MVAPLVAAAIPAVGSLLGGLFGQKSQSDMAEKNIEMQKEFAQKGVQWKVADSLKAGIHPLFGLGASTTSFAPVSVGDSLGPAIAQSGQEIGRAVGASMSSEQQVSAKMNALTLERGSLENELLRSQIRAMNAPGSPPGLPSVSGDNSSPLKAFGVSIQKNPQFSDAQEFSNRYGEPAEWLASVPIAAADALHNLPPQHAGYGRGYSPTVGEVYESIKRMFGY